eukprot:9005070-Pyramimonas_sp.AAC.1
MSTAGRAACSFRCCQLANRYSWVASLSESPSSSLPPSSLIGSTGSCRGAGASTAAAGSTAPRAP